MLSFAPLSTRALSELSAAVTPTPPTPPAAVAVAVTPGLQEATGAAGGYLIPQEFVPTSQATDFAQPFGHKTVARFFGHPKPGQAYPPQLKSVDIDPRRAHWDDEEILTVLG